MRAGLAALLACLFTGGPAAAIVDAILVDPQDHPEVVVIRDQNASCFGTAIAPNVVLTSAVCVSDKAYVDYQRTGGNTKVLAPANRRGKERLDCVLVGDQTGKVNVLAICRTGGPVLQFAVLAPAADSDAKELTIFGKQCEVPTYTGTSFALASRVVPVRRFDSRRWIADGIAACAGDQGAPAFLVNEDTDLRRQVAGIVVGYVSSSDEGRSILLTSTKLDIRTKADLGVAASQLGVKICGVNFFETRACTYLPIPDSVPDSAPDPNPPQTNVLSVEFEDITHIPGESLLDLVERACKFATPDHLALIESYLGEDYLTLIREPIPASDVVDGTVSLPVCPNSTRVEQRDIIPGDAASKYFSRDPTHLGFPKLGPEDGSDLASYFGAFYRVNPTYDGVLRLGERVNVPIIDTASAEPAPSDSGPRSAAQGRAVLAASLQPGSADYACSTHPSADPMHYPFDISALMLALYTNQQLRSGTPAVADVMIADTGLFLKRGASGGQEYFAVNDPDDREAVPLILDRLDATHGTQVASVALGGPFLAQLWSLTGTRRINIRSVRIFGFNQDFEDFSTQLEAIKRAAEDDANVINLSVAGTDRTMFDPLDLRRNDRWPLFVVAAGNNAGNTADDRTVALPGDMGGDTRHNLISVANQDGTSLLLHNTSSFHPRNVDIAAPGCEIPVIGWSKDHYVAARATGTSIAAPLVSFAAALVFGEGRDKSAAEIKLRLMISSDLSPQHDAVANHVSNTVRDGRRLNIIKAVSLHQDLIEVPNDFGDPGSQLLHGIVRLLQDGVEDPDAAIHFTECGDDGDLFIKPGAILKLWPFDGGAKLRIYYQPKAAGPDTGDPLFESATCAPPDNLTLQISTMDEPRTVALSGLIDFVRWSR